jgi:hypothetical protein
MFGRIQSYNHTFIPGITFSFILLLLLSFAACSDKTVDHEKFIDAYVDLRIAEDTITTGDKDIQKLKAEILKRHGMSEEQYKSAFEYFNDNPELWEQFYDKAIARVDSLKKMKK